MGKRLDGRHNEDASERQSCLASMCGGSEGVCLRGRQGLKVMLRRVSPASLTAALQCLLEGWECRCLSCCEHLLLVAGPPDTLFW